MEDEPVGSARIAMVPVDEGMEAQLAAFFADLLAAGDEATFHPHPLTPAAARSIARRTGLDVYMVATIGDQVVGYGMLRGWDDGFAAPSLGVAVHPAHRGHGLGRRIMDELHGIARSRGSDRVRLTVAANHVAARSLYESLGYRFDTGADGRMVGWLEIDGGESRRRVGDAP
jgi:ribosomal protein S18 acetylase RimI-like enzyme